MTINFTILQSLMTGLNELASKELPFKLSLIIAKNLSLLEKEQEFYISQEREFAMKYLVMEDGQFVQERENIFKIKEGLEKECQEARETLNKFESTVELRKIPVSLIENMEFNPKTLMMLESIIDEEA